MTATGKGLFLAGPSSAGKSSLARALQAALPEPWVLLQADTISDGYPRSRPEFVTIVLDRRLRTATMLAIRGFLDAGLNVIAEQGLWDEWARPVAARIFSSYSAFVVQLRCDLAIREARETSRTEIRPGFTRWQEENEPWDMRHDFAIDTDSEAPHVLAARVAVWLSSGPHPTAFRLMLPH